MASSCQRSYMGTYDISLLLYESAEWPTDIHRRCSILLKEEQYWQRIFAPAMTYRSSPALSKTTIDKIRIKLKMKIRLPFYMVNNNLKGTTNSTLSRNFTLVTSCLKSSCAAGSDCLESFFSCVQLQRFFFQSNRIFAPTVKWRTSIALFETILS